MNLTGNTVQRVDPTINFAFGATTPFPGVIPPDGFSIRWTGELLAPATDTYTIYATADDGVRVWVSGALLADGWKDQGPTEYSGSIALVGGQKYSLVVEYYEDTGGAEVDVSWSSSTITKQIIPNSQLFLPPPDFDGGTAGTTGSGGGGAGGNVDAGSDAAQDSGSDTASSPDAPNPITDLAAALFDRRATSFKLSWTAPSTVSGAALSGYQVRYAKVPITAANFDDTSVTTACPLRRDAARRRRDRTA